MCEMSHNHHDREPKGFGFLVDMDTDDDVRRQQPTLFRRAMNSWMIVLVLLTLTAINSAPMFFGKIPFPADIVFAFPPFMAVIPDGPPAPHADIGDLVHFFYPFRTLAASNARKGELPLWNPYILSGTPFLADAQSALFYPLNFFYYILPVPLAWAMSFPLRTLLAGLFTVLFVRKIGGSKTGATISAILFSFCGFLIIWQGQAMSDAAIWLPLICYSVVRLHSELSARSLVLTSLAFALPVLAGHPETAAHPTLTGVGLAGLLAVARPDAHAPRVNLPFIKFFTAAGMLALGLASVQMIPTLEWLQYVRHSFHDPWPPLPLWSMLAVASRDLLRTTNSMSLQIPEQAAYLGLLSFIAAPVALLHPSRRIVIFFAVWSAVAISIAYGFGPIFELVHHVPVLKILKNNRLILVSSFGVAVLAGLGISTIEHLPISLSLQRFRALMLSVIGFAVGLMMVYLVHLMTDQMVEFVRFPRFSLLLLFAFMAVLASRLLLGIRNRPFQLALIALVGVDVLTVSYGAIPFAKPRDVFPPIELFDRIKSDNPRFSRIAQIGYSVGPNFELMYGLSSVGGYEVCLERIKTFLGNISTDEMPNVTLTAKGVLGMRDRRLDMLNAKYFVVSEWDPLHLEFRLHPDRFRFIFSSENTEVFENLRVLPAAFLVPASGIEVMAREEQELARVMDPAFDPERSVVVPEGFSTVPTNFPSVRPGLEKVEWVSRGTDDFQLKVDAVRKSVLLISQIYYPGWNAYVDGAEVAVFRANYALSAINLSPGSHDIRFSFEPVTFRVGLVLSALALMVIAIIALFFSGRHSRCSASRFTPFAVSARSNFR